MKDILIFGESSPMTNPTIHIGGSWEGRVSYVSKKKLEVDINSIIAHRPDLIVNIVEPSEEVAFHQNIMANLKDAQIIDLY